MIGGIAISRSQPFPVILKYTEIRSYIFTTGFVLLNVAVPWIFHQFHLAGPTFLPMHIFVLMAGLLFGWRTGLIVGLLSPLASYATSGMPVLRILPQIVMLIPFYFLLIFLNLTNKLIGLTICYIILFIPFGTLMLRSYIETAYPKELEESAEIDGCNYYQIFYRITIPLCAPGVAAVGIFAFIGSWNEFMWASVMITDAKLKTIQTGLHAFAGEAGVLVDPSVAFAAGAIIVFPVVLATFFMQKYMVSGLTAGAIKD